MGSINITPYLLWKLFAMLLHFKGIWGLYYYEAQLSYFIDEETDSERASVQGHTDNGGRACTRMSTATSEILPFLVLIGAIFTLLSSPSFKFSDVTKKKKKKKERKGTIICLQWAHPLTMGR